MGFNCLGFVAIMAANTCCSVEMEPKTLSQGQIHQARVAADFVQKMKEKDASNEFIKVQGMESVGEEEKVQKEEQLNIGNDKKFGVIERPCQCSVNKTLESPDHVNLKEPLSAPF